MMDKGRVEEGLEGEMKWRFLEIPSVVDNLC
jgi:hypothetical protein